MLRSLARFIRDRRGNSAVEFGLYLPFFMLVFGGFVELGRVYSQATAIEKGLRAGVLYSARSSSPSDAQVLDRSFNLVRTGTLDGAGPLLAANWAHPSARLQASFTRILVDQTNVPVVRFTAEVPFQPIMPGLANAIGLGPFNLVLSHEQAYVGQ